jgi:hypothetical protein
MTEEGQPRRSGFSALGPIVCRQNPPDHIFVDLQPEGFGQVLRDPGTTKAGITLFEFTDELDQLRIRSFRAYVLAVRSKGAGI